MNNQQTWRRYRKIVIHGVSNDDIQFCTFCMIRAINIYVIIINLVSDRKFCVYTIQIHFGTFILILIFNRTSLLDDHRCCAVLIIKLSNGYWSTDCSINSFVCNHFHTVNTIFMSKFSTFKQIGWSSNEIKYSYWARIINNKTAHNDNKP